MRLLLSVAGLAAAGLFAMAEPAQAQATRTWVSGVGDDVNPCSRTAPCKTLAGAISRTAASGEINCLDPGGFGGVTITKSITILCPRGWGGVLAGGNGVVVNVASSDRVLLEGLDIFIVSPASNGIRMIGSGSLIVRNSSIKGGSPYGIDLAGAANATVLIEDTMIRGNVTAGLRVQGAGGVANYAFINKSTFFDNGAAAVEVGPAGAVLITGSTLINNGQTISNSGGSVTSFGNNTFVPSANITATAPLR
jgi:hypothetical protein